MLKVCEILQFSNYVSLYLMELLQGRDARRTFDKQTNRRRSITFFSPSRLSPFPLLFVRPPLPLPPSSRQLRLSPPVTFNSLSPSVTRCHPLLQLSSTLFNTFPAPPRLESTMRFTLAALASLASLATVTVAAPTIIGYGRFPCTSESRSLLLSLSLSGSLK